MGYYKMKDMLNKYKKGTLMYDIDLQCDSTTREWNDKCHRIFKNMSDKEFSDYVRKRSKIEERKLNELERKSRKRFSVY